MTAYKRKRKRKTKAKFCLAAWKLPHLCGDQEVYSIFGCYDKNGYASVNRYLSSYG
jgi:hypothetical protein